jgi:N-acetylneuraminate synthase
MARFIAEIGSNHNRDLGRALQLVDECAAAGAEAVKIQVFRVGDLFAPEILATREDLRARSAWEFPVDEMLEPLAEAAHERGLAFGATPFGLWAVDAIAPHVDFLKVASYELLWHDLLRACAATGLPLIVSTGMATDGEIDEAVRVVREAGGEDLTLLHCVSAYPTPLDQCNLAAIAALRERHGCRAGWSDHSAQSTVVERAVRRWGADDVELHIDLADEVGHEAGEHNWTPDRLAETIAACAGPPLDDASPADGDGVKRLMPAEAHDAPWRADPSDGLRPLIVTRESVLAARP